MLSRIIQIEVHLWHYEYALSFDSAIIDFFPVTILYFRLESVENKKKNSWSQAKEDEINFYCW